MRQRTSLAPLPRTLSEHHERREVDDVDFPDRCHAQFGIVEAFHCLDVLFAQKMLRRLVRPELEQGIERRLDGLLGLRQTGVQKNPFQAR